MEDDPGEVPPVFSRTVAAIIKMISAPAVPKQRCLIILIVSLLLAFIPEKRPVARLRIKATGRLGNGRMRQSACAERNHLRARLHLGI